MSSADLPADWPRRPLTEPDLVHGVLDMFVTGRDRRDGGIVVLALRRDLTLAQPVFLAGEIPRLERRAGLCDLLLACTRGEPDAAVAVAIVHEAGALTDADRELHQTLIELCAEHAIRLLSAHLVTAWDITTLPGLHRAA